MDAKKEFRKEMKKLRAKVTQAEAIEAEAINYQHLRESSLYQEHSWIYPYISYQKELPTHALIDLLIKDGKHVAVPRVLGEEMEFFEIRSLQDCQPGCMGILEPGEHTKEAHEKGLILMPGLAFDEKGGRMGYGGGFYDKYLARYPYHTTAAWMYDIQQVDDVPMEEHDHRIDYLISPKRGVQVCKKECE